MHCMKSTRVLLQVIFREFEMVYISLLLFSFLYHLPLVKSQVQENLGSCSPTASSHPHPQNVNTFYLWKNLKFNSNLISSWMTFFFLLFDWGSLCGEVTANTWWILLLNDRKSRHRRTKNKRCYERLCCNTSQVCLWGWRCVSWAGRVGTMMNLSKTRGFFTFLHRVTTGWILQVTLHKEIKFCMTYNGIVTLPVQKTLIFYSHHVTGHWP